MEHPKEVGWVLFLVYLFLGLLVLIFRAHVEFATALKICLGFALVVTAVFVSILLCNLLGIALMKLIHRLRQRPK
jgi:hypothetical protein